MDQDLLAKADNAPWDAQVLVLFTTIYYCCSGFFCVCAESVDLSNLWLRWMWKICGSACLQVSGNLVTTLTFVCFTCCLSYKSMEILWPLGHFLVLLLLLLSVLLLSGQATCNGAASRDAFNCLRNVVCEHIYFFRTLIQPVKFSLGLAGS